MMTVWLFEPHSHGRRKADTRARNGAPLPGRRPSSHTCPIIDLVMRRAFNTRERVTVQWRVVAYL